MTSHNPQSRGRRYQKWYQENADYFTKRYEDNKDIYKVRRFNRDNPTLNPPLPDDALSVIRARQDTLCYDCHAPLPPTEYIFIDPSQSPPYSAVLVCLPCRRKRRHPQLLAPSPYMEEY